MKIVKRNQYEDDYDDEYYEEEPQVIVIREGESIWTPIIVVGVLVAVIYGFYYFYIKSPIMQAGQAVMNIPQSFGLQR